MKRLLIASTAIGVALAFGPAMANDSTIEQIGAANTATVNQTGGTGGTSDILQTGDNDLATVTQSDGGGTATNDASIQQLGGSGSQTATITQNNAANGAANSASIIQDSTQGGNLADINQDGDGNTATAQQGPGAAENCTLGGCSGTSPDAITNSVSSILQSGSGNNASTTQIVGSNGGDNNMASISQDGAANDASIVQGTGAVSAVGVFSPSIPNPASNDNDNLAEIAQIGAGNMSAVEQGGESGLAFNTQIGSANNSVIVQSGGLPGLGNLANVTQTGVGNDSTVTQTSADGDLPALPSGAQAIVVQNGTDNVSTVSQAPLGGHLAVVTQTGSDHVSLVAQDGLINVATVTQELSNQSSEVFQTGPSIVGPLGNEAVVSQTVTSGNTSFVSQSGVGNFASVSQ